MCIKLLCQIVNPLCIVKEEEKMFSLLYKEKHLHCVQSYAACLCLNLEISLSGKLKSITRMSSSCVEMKWAQYRAHTCHCTISLMIPTQYIVSQLERNYKKAATPEANLLVFEWLVVQNDIFKGWEEL